MSVTIKMSLGLTLGLSLALSAQLASADDLRTYQYLARIPATRKTCDQEAIALGDHFAALTGYAVTEKVCHGVVKTQFDGAPVELFSLLITYQAPSPASIYRASLGEVRESVSNSIETGAYATYSECLSQMPVQTSKFVNNTGLAVLTTYCSPSVIGLGTQYALSIEGYGAPKRELRSYHLPASAADHQTNGEIEVMLIAAGADIVRESGDAVLYYSETALNIENRMFALYADSKQCESQIAALTEIYSHSGITLTPVIHCLPEVGRSALYGVAVNPAMMADSLQALEYYTLDECVQDKDRVLKANHDQYVGALCMRDEFSNLNLFVMTLYRFY